MSRPWPLVSLVPIAAVSWSGQVPSRSSSRVRSPGSSTGAVALRSQTALTGSDRPRTIRQREQGRPAGTRETCYVLSGPCFVFRASRPALVRPEREPWRERRPGRRGGGASGPAGRLETVQKVLTRGSPTRVSCPARSRPGGTSHAGTRAARVQRQRALCRGLDCPRLPRDSRGMRNTAQPPAREGQPWR